MNSSKAAFSAGVEWNSYYLGKQNISLGLSLLPHGGVVAGGWGGGERDSFLGNPDNQSSGLFKILWVFLGAGYSKGLQNSLKKS